MLDSMPVSQFERLLQLDFPTPLNTPTSIRKKFNVTQICHDNIIERMLKPFVTQSIIHLSDSFRSPETKQICYLKRAAPGSADHCVSSQCLVENKMTLVLSYDCIATPAGFLRSALLKLFHSLCSVFHSTFSSSIVHFHQRN